MDRRYTIDPNHGDVYRIFDNYSEKWLDETYVLQVQAQAAADDLNEMNEMEASGLLDVEAEKTEELGIEDAMESFKPPANSQGWVTPTRAKLLRYLFDRTVFCSECKTVFTAELGKRNIHQLKFLYGDRAYHTVIDDPDYLKVDLECLFCNHRGVIELRPNPFMDDKNIEEYARIVQEETI